MARVKMVVVTGQIDEVVMRNLQSHFPVWQWAQEDENTATGVWRQDYYDCLFNPRVDFSVLSNWMSITNHREFNVIP